MWNVSEWWNKRDEIKEKIKEYDIAVLTEIKNRKGQIFKISEYKTLKTIIITRMVAGGVAVIMKNNIKAEINEDIVTDDNNIDCAAVQIMYGKKRLTSSVCTGDLEKRQKRIHGLT